MYEENLLYSTIVYIIYTFIFCVIYIVNIYDV